MKRLVAGIAVMALIILVSSTTVLAARGGRGRNFVDSDNNGVCDRYNSSCKFVDEDGDGICDNCAIDSCGKGAGYVDEDGDGICDNFAAGTPKNGTGLKRGRCGGRGRCGR